jgi:hypothetical protein
MQSFASEAYRKQILDEILGAENVTRKRESFRKQEIYKKRQQPYVIERMKEDGFGDQTISDMRKIMSINPAPKIVKEMARLYEEPPKRTITLPDGKPLSEQQQAQADSLYELAKANVKLKRANRTYKYQDQAIAQVIPSRGIIDLRIYHPHQIDVVPKEDDPEVPFGYVISSYDRAQSLVGGDGIDQKISDRNDAEYAKREKMRFVWWSNEHNLITDGHGKIAQADPLKIENAIGELPFVDISEEKENEFWVRTGNAIIEFTLDFALVLSDTANTNRLQSYAQAVMTSKDKPENLQIGPTKVLWVPLTGDSSEPQARFEFVTPNPDMASSLDLLDRLMNFFLSCEDVDVNAVQSKGEGTKYGSGYERFLALIEKFRASKEDESLFTSVEEKIFRLMVKWSNAYQGTIGAEQKLDKRLLQAKLPEDLKFSIKFGEPQVVQNKTEIEDSAIKLMEKKLSSRVQAIMALDGISEDQAIAKLKKIEEHEAMFATTQTDEIVVDEDGEQEESTSDASGKVPVIEGKAADTALNGAQVTALIDVVRAVTLGELPRESAVRIVETAFLVSTQEAERLIGPAGKSFKPPTPPAPAPNPGKDAA